MKNNLRALRIKAKLTQGTLAEKLGVTKGYICNVEKGLRTPSTTVTLKILSALKCKIHDLYPE